VAIEFNHKREILAIREGFPRYYMAKTLVKVEWGADFAENAFRSASISGTGKSEKLVLSTKLQIDTKDIPVTFIENAEGALTIEVNKKMVYTIKPKGRISQKLLEAFTCSIIRNTYDEKR